MTTATSRAPQFGVCYYPEQWPQNRWETDADLMVELGLTLVRIGEFAWSSYEPVRGQFDFAWLDRAVAVLVDRNLQIVLGTPTATPPVWLMRDRPDVLAVGPDGRRRAYGSRRHTCVTSEAYREESQRIVAVLLDRYSAHPGIVAWQVDNEVGSHDSARCWCNECQAAFTAGLAARYGTIEALNEAWGTAFWSMSYPDFDAIRLPEPTVTVHHPALRLAHVEFASTQALQFLSAQFDQIAGTVSPDVAITTNFHSEDIAVDQRAAARLGGLASIDSYPHSPDDPLVTAYHLDLNRGAAGPDGAAWIMEQQIGPVNWTDMNQPVPDGQVRTWLWQAALHGHEAMLLFRWRAARHGQEIYHSGVLRQDGSKTRAYDEAKAAIAEITHRVDLPAPRPKVALLHSYRDAWAMAINPHRSGMTHRSLQMGAYRAARRLGFDVAVVDPLDDLSTFDWVLAPALQIVTPARVDAIAQALDAGVKVVLGPRSLVVDDDYAWSAEALPAGLAHRLQARVVEGLSQVDDVTVEPWAVDAGEWTDVLESDGADVLATYGGGTYLDGRAAAVANDGLFYAGFSGDGAWLAFLGSMTGRVAQPEHHERFDRGSLGTVTLDHETRDVTIEQAVDG